MLIHRATETYNAAPDKPLVLALGNFDGVHCGHRQLLSKAVSKAAEIGGHAAVFTFREHPQRVLHPENKPRLLTSVEHKLFLLREMDIRECFLIPFTEEFASIEAEQFVSEILVKRLNVKHLYMGFNARFGKGRKGDSSLMAEFAEKYGFGFEMMEPFKVGDQFVSSSLIRSMVSEGRLENLPGYLGRPFSCMGEVVHGSGRGTDLGFPTANLNVGSEILPPEGVYPVLLREIDMKCTESEFHVGHTGPWLQGVLNYGSRPTFAQNGDVSVAEVFIVDFHENLYGKKLEVVYYPRLREEKAFEGPEQLKAQIQSDIQAALKILTS